MKASILHRNAAKELCRELVEGMTRVLDGGPSYGAFVEMQVSAVKAVLPQTWSKVSRKTLTRVAARLPVVAAYQKPQAKDVRVIEGLLAKEIPSKPVKGKTNKQSGD